MDEHSGTDWRALTDRLVSVGAGRVVLVGPSPRWEPSLPEVVTTYYWGGAATRAQHGLVRSLAETDSVLKAVTAGVDHLEYVSLIDRLCGVDGCLAVVPGSTGRDLMAFDAGHLTPKGSVYIAHEVLRAVVRRFDE